MVSKMVGLHQQTLRNYERWNLIVPYRSPGGTRYYSVIDIEKIEKVKDWIDKFGINRAGIEIITELMKEILELENKNNFLESELLRYKSRGYMKELPERNERYV
ncbi:MAG: MerR family transcriptional regulator [Dehalococcoidia bacterium]|nr:MerR family transcriptional regulator [Dehalococcoidia bacterium]